MPSIYHRAIAIIFLRKAITEQIEKFASSSEVVPFLKGLEVTREALGETIDLFSVPKEDEDPGGEFVAVFDQCQVCKGSGYLQKFPEICFGCRGEGLILLKSTPQIGPQ